MNNFNNKNDRESIFWVIYKVKGSKTKKMQILILRGKPAHFQWFFFRILIQILATKFKLVEFEHIRTRKWQNPKFWQIGHFWHFV